jgi:hypothetical protein
MGQIKLTSLKIMGVERFICRCDFSDNPIPRKAQFRFNHQARFPQDQYWYTEDIQVAARLRHYAEGELRQRLNQAGAKPKLKPTLSLQGDIFFFRTEREGREQAKEAGFTSDKQNASWWTRDSDRALLLIHYADESCRDYLQAVINQLEEARAASRAVDADIEIPRPANLKDNYLPYQRGAVAFAARVLNLNAKGGEISPSRGMLYADEMG